MLDLVGNPEDRFSGVAAQIELRQIVTMPNEPVHEKTNNLGSHQVRHKPACTFTEDG